jgi:hypothetical protein
MARRHLAWRVARDASARGRRPPPLAAPPRRDGGGVGLQGRLLPGARGAAVEPAQAGLVATVVAFRRGFNRWLPPPAQAEAPQNLPSPKRGAREWRAVKPHEAPHGMQSPRLSATIVSGLHLNVTRSRACSTKANDCPARALRDLAYLVLKADRLAIRRGCTRQGVMVYLRARVARRGSVTTPVCERGSHTRCRRKSVVGKG